MSRFSDYQTSVRFGQLAPLRTIEDMDARWLEFVIRTKDIFSSYPFLVPLRQTIFKKYVDKKPKYITTDHLKRWIKMASKHQRSVGDTTSVDVVFWLDSYREVLVEAIIPVIHRLSLYDVKASLIIQPELVNKIETNRIQIIKFYAPYQWYATKDWNLAWSALCSEFPEDIAHSYLSDFLNNVNVSTNIMKEAENLFFQLQPKLVVSALDHLLPSSAFISSAKQMDIKSLILLHGAVIPYNVPLTGDLMAVWGKTSYDQMVKLGVSQQQLVVLGSPRHDRFPILSAKEARLRLKTLLGLADNKPYFVFFSNGNDPLRNSVEALEGCAKWLNEVSQRLGDRIEFLVRLHPNEDGQLYKACRQLKVFKNECDLDTVLGAVDVCAALCSTTLSDALLYHKPVLQFYADGWPDLADNWQRGIAKRIESADHLYDFLESGINAWNGLSDIQRTYQENVFAHHKTAVDAICQFILREISS